jgi:hypothetical protein
LRALQNNADVSNFDLFKRNFIVWIQNFGGMFVVMTCKTYKTPNFVTLVLNFSGFKCNSRIVLCSSGISICPPLPRSQISPSMSPLVLFIISMEDPPSRPPQAHLRARSA